MKALTRVSIVWAALLLIPAVTSAQVAEPDADEGVEEVVEATEDKDEGGRFDDFLNTVPPEEWEPDPDASWFSNFIGYEVNRILGMDLYGVTAQLPAGWLKFKWDWGMIEAGSRYNGVGDLGPVMEPIQFEQDGNTLISADLGLSGQGGGHTIQMSYGIIDPLDWYIEHTWFYQNVSLDPVLEQVDDNGNFIDPSVGSLIGVDDPQNYNAEQFLYDTLPRLGRPTPSTTYRGRRVTGDINTGFSWNYFRNMRMSASVTPRVFLPTGNQPPPNQNLTYGTGPALETSVGGWIVSATQGLDFRVYRRGFLDIITSTETTLGYGFRQSRPYPTNFVEPDPLAQQLDPVAFPDLSDLEGDFEYTPGWSFDWNAQLSVALGPLGLLGGYGIQHSTEPLIRGDEEFVQMVEALELLGSQTLYLVQGGASLSLLPIYIPMNIGFSYRAAVAGRDAIVFDNYWTISAEMFLPIFALWNPRPWEND